MQLRVDNKVLAEESARLASQLAEVQHARGGITTVPVPGKPLWLIVCLLLKAPLAGPLGYPPSNCLCL